MRPSPVPCHARTGVGRRGARPKASARRRRWKRQSCNFLAPERCFTGAPCSSTRAAPRFARAMNDGSFAAAARRCWSACSGRGSTAGARRSVRGPSTRSLCQRKERRAPPCRWAPRAPASLPRWGQASAPSSRCALTKHPACPGACRRPLRCWGTAMSHLAWAWRSPAGGRAGRVQRRPCLQRVLRAQGPASHAAASVGGCGGGGTRARRRGAHAVGHDGHLRARGAGYRLRLTCVTCGRQP